MKIRISIHLLFGKGKRSLLRQWCKLSFSDEFLLKIELDYAQT